MFTKARFIILRSIKGTSILKYQKKCSKTKSSFFCWANKREYRKINKNKRLWIHFGMSTVETCPSTWEIKHRKTPWTQKQRDDKHNKIKNKKQINYTTNHQNNSSFSSWISEFGTMILLSLSRTSIIINKFSYFFSSYFEIKQIGTRVMKICLFIFCFALVFEVSYAFFVQHSSRRMRDKTNSFDIEWCGAGRAPFFEKSVIKCLDNVFIEI